MRKKLLSAVLAALLSLSLVPFSVIAASAAVDASYSTGVVTVTGTGFSAGADYLVRVINKTSSSVTAMDQVTSSVSGAFTAYVTTGALTTVSDYVVYVNKQDGTLAGEDSSITTASSSGGSSSGGTTTSGTTKTSPVITTTENKTSASITATVTDGKTSVTVDSDTAGKLLSSALSQEAAGETATVEIKVEASSSTGATSAEVGIDKDDLAKLAAQTDALICVNTTLSKITFDAKAVESISGAATGDISISVTAVEKDSLTDAVKNEVGDRPVYSFSVTSGGSTITDFGGGSAAISIPYAPAAGEDIDCIVVYYINASGELENVRGAYNSATGTVDFVASHFSSYMVGYNKITFTDVNDGEWYKNAVDFIAARGITTGTGGNMFSPDATLTRGQFIVMLMKAYGLSPDATPTDNFSDAGNTYYTNYLSAAKRLGISTGTGGNRFSPDGQITRQDMFTLLYRALNVIGELPESTTNKSLSDFSDSSLIAEYAEQSMAAFSTNGIITGSGGKLDPLGVSTRAEMAQVLYKLLSR